MSHEETKEHTSPRPAESLPVTSEVGSEGGSYADPTAQVATEKGHLPVAKPPQPQRTEPGVVAEAVQPGPDAPEDGVRTPDDTRVMPD
jgi:hypothetical protein